jgi:hypothetical protein
MQNVLNMLKANVRGLANAAPEKETASDLVEGWGKDFAEKLVSRVRISSSGC